MRHMLLATILTLSVAAGAYAQDRPQISLVSPQSLYPTKLSATGRVIPVLSARVGSRIAGYIAQFGKDKQGKMLDIGMSVEAGQTVFTVDATTFRNTVAVAETQLASAQASLANLTAPTREERLDQLRQALAELDARIVDRKRDEQRYRRLVEVDKTMPARRLEEVMTELETLGAQRRSAEARLREATNGPTATEIAVAQAQVKSAEAALHIAQTDLKDTAVTAPFAGVVTRRYKSPGDYVAAAPFVEVMEIVSADNLEAELRLPEATLAAITQGTTQVTLRSTLLPQSLVLPITRVIPDIDIAKGSYAIRIAIPADRRGRLIPGTFITADIDVPEGAAPMIAPQRAISEVDGKTYIFIARNGKMARQQVDLGDRLTEGVVVRTGVKAGDKIVLGPNDLLKDGADLPAELQAGK